MLCGETMQRSLCTSYRRSIFLLTRDPLRHTMPPAHTHCPSLQHSPELRLTEPNGRFRHCQRTQPSAVRRRTVLSQTITGSCYYCCHDRKEPADAEGSALP